MIWRCGVIGGLLGSRIVMKAARRLADNMREVLVGRLGIGPIASVDLKSAGLTILDLLKD